MKETGDLYLWVSEIVPGDAGVTLTTHTHHTHTHSPHTHTHSPHTHTHHTNTHSPHTHTHTLTTHTHTHSPHTHLPHTHHTHTYHTHTTHTLTTHTNTTHTNTTHTAHIDSTGKGSSKSSEDVAIKKKYSLIEVLILAQAFKKIRFFYFILLSFF